MNDTIMIALVVFVLKLLDCTFNTLKTIYLYKNKYALSAALNTISNMLYLVAVVQIAKSPDGWYGIAAVGAATFLGTWLPAKLARKVEGDRLWIYEITSPDMKSGQEYADMLRENNVPVNTAKAYNKTRDKALAIRVYSTSKATSKLVEDNMPDDFKWIVYCPSAD